MAHDVFISYSSEDKTAASLVCAVLEQRLIRCWIAPRDIVSGRDWPASIIEAINEAKVFVLIFSSSSNASGPVKREVERAAHRDLPIIPFRITDTEANPSLEFFLSTPHWLDAVTPPLKRHAEHLADTIERLIGPSDLRLASVAAPVGSPAPSSAAVKAASPWRPRLAVAAAVLATVTVLALILIKLYPIATPARMLEAKNSSTASQPNANPIVPTQPASGGSDAKPQTGPPIKTNVTPIIMTQAKVVDPALAATVVPDKFQTGAHFPAKQDATCNSRGNVFSTNGPNLPVNVVNKSGQPLKIYWVGADGKEHDGGDLNEQPDAFSSGADTPYVVTDGSGQCIRIFRATEKYAYFTFVPAK